MTLGACQSEIFFDYSCKFVTAGRVRGYSFTALVRVENLYSTIVVWWFVDWLRFANALAGSPMVNRCDARPRDPAL